MYSTMNSQLDPQDPLRDQIQIQPDEQPYDGAGFPGCGDGSDDLADMNQNEAGDYRGE